VSAMTVISIIFMNRTEVYYSVCTLIPWIYNDSIFDEHYSN